MRNLRLLCWSASFVSVALLIVLVQAQSNPLHQSQSAAVNRANQIPAARQQSEVAQAGQDPPLKFAHAVAYGSGGITPQSVAIADVNGDGNADIVVSNYSQSAGGPGPVGVLFGNGDGSFQPAVTYDSGGVMNLGVAVADLRGNGKLDIVVASCAAVSGSCSSSDGVVSVLLGNGDGTFQSAVVYDSGAPKANGLTVADVNGDGIPDVIVANQSTTENGDGTVAVLFGNGDGTLQDAVTYDSGGPDANGVAVADVNGDGSADIVVANYCSAGVCQSGSVAVLINNGNGTFQAPVVYSPGGDYTGSVAVADVNGDGYPDLIVGNLSGSVGVLLNSGNGEFEPVVTYAAGRGVPQLVVTDVNGDGIPDIIVSTDAQNAAGVLVGNGNGTFQPMVGFHSGGFDANTLTVGDVNGDGRPDIVVTNGASDAVGVLLNTLTRKTHTTLTSSPNPSTVGQVVTLTATVTSTVAIPNGEVVTFSAGKTVLGTGTTNNGVATLNTSFSKAVHYAIKASFPSVPFYGKSSGIVKQVVTGQ